MLLCCPRLANLSKEPLLKNLLMSLKLQSEFTGDSLSSLRKEPKRKSLKTGETKNPRGSTLNCRSSDPSGLVGDSNFSKKTAIKLRPPLRFCFCPK